jgi:multimeric flavodoxin WrbA
MHAIAISGSPRRGGNTDTLLERCLRGLASAHCDTELIRVCDYYVKPCKACAGCTRSGDGSCSQTDDDFASLLDQMLGADIIVVGSPVYFGSATPQLMALLDRVGHVSRHSGNRLSRKVGGAVAIARRAGQNFTFAQLTYWFLINDMIVPGSSYWNVGTARDPGDIINDTEALTTIDRFAENLAFVANATRKAIP